MLYEKLNNDIIEAMKSKNKETLSTLRMLKSDIDLYKINNKLDVIDDGIVIAVASKQVKSHKETIVEFTNANRMDLVESLKKEIRILEKYLPEQLSEEAVRGIINEVFEEVHPEGRKDMGRIMQILNIKLRGKADMKLVSKIVLEKLE